MLADLLQHMTFGQRITAHDKQWTIVYVLPGSNDQALYLAIEEAAALPAPVSVIAVPRAPVR